MSLYLEQSEVYRRNNSIESFAYITAHSTHTQMLLHEILSRHKEANVSTLTLLMLDAEHLKIYYRSLEKVIAQIATEIEMREIMLDSVTEVEGGDDTKKAFEDQVNSLPDDSIRTTFYALVLSGIVSVCSFFRNTAETITQGTLAIIREIGLELVATVGHAARTFITVVADMIPMCVVALLTSSGAGLLSLMATVLELINIEQLMIWISLYYLSGLIVPWITRTMQATIRSIASSTFRVIGNGLAQINVRQPSELTYTGPSRNAEIEVIEDIDMSAIEFRYIEQINDALIPGQQLRLEYIEAFEEEEVLLTHVPAVNLPSSIPDDFFEVRGFTPEEMNEFELELGFDEIQPGDAVLGVIEEDDGMGLGFDDAYIEAPMMDPEMPRIQYHELPAQEFDMIEVEEELLPAVEAGMAITEILGGVFTVAFTIGFVIYGMEQSHNERVAIMNEINRQNDVYENHIAYLFKTLNVTQFNFPYMSGSFKHGFNDMHTEIYTWTQKDFMGSLFENYMMWRVDQSLKHGINFTTPTIQQSIDFCNKLWMKYISPGAPLQIFDLDQQYITFPVGILNEYKGTTKLSPDISYGPMSLSTFITSYQCIMQDKLTRNKAIYEEELNTWISEVHKRAPLENGLAENAKKSWSNSAARFIAFKEAITIEEFRIKPEFIDQKTISFLQQFIALPKTRMDRDKMRLFEIVDKPIDISKLFRLSTSAYTFVPSIAPREQVKEIFHAVQMPDCAVYASETRMIMSLPQNKTVVIGPSLIDTKQKAFNITIIRETGAVEYIVSNSLIWSTSPYTVLHYEHYLGTSDHRGTVEWRDMERKVQQPVVLFVENPFMWVNFAFEHPDRWAMVPNRTSGHLDIPSVLQLIQAITVPTNFETITQSYNYGELTRFEKEDNTVIETVDDSIPTLDFNMTKWDISQYYFGPIHLIQLVISGIVMLFQKPGPGIVSTNVIMLSVGSALSAVVPLSTIFVMSMTDSSSFHRTTIPVRPPISSIMTVLYSITSNIPKAIMQLPLQTKYIVKSPIGVFLYDNTMKLVSGVMKEVIQQANTHPIRTLTIAYVFSNTALREDAIHIANTVLEITGTTIHGISHAADTVDYVLTTAKAKVGETMTGYMILSIVGLIVTAAVNYEVERRKRAPKRKREKIIKLY